MSEHAYQAMADSLSARLDDVIEQTEDVELLDERLRGSSRQSYYHALASHAHVCSVWVPELRWPVDELGDVASGSHMLTRLISTMRKKMKILEKRVEIIKTWADLGYDEDDNDDCSPLPDPIDPPGRTRRKSVTAA